MFRQQIDRARQPAQPGAGWRRYARQALSLVLLAHLLILYVALLQMPAGGPLRFYWDAPWWLALQILLSALVSQFWFALLRRQGVAVSLQLGSSVLLVASLLLLPQLLIDQALQLAWQPGLLAKQWLSYALVQLLVGLWLLYQHGQQQALEQQRQLYAAQASYQTLQLSLLQQQFEPHFLFNNLNVLSALMHRSADEADDFLQRFTAVYRYVWLHKSTALVPLHDELRFAEDYLALLNQRFANSYLLQYDAGLATDELMLVPGTLQLALENLVKHNQASPQHPLTLTLTLTSDAAWLLLHNPLRPKQIAAAAGGYGLSQLVVRCQAATGQPAHYHTNADSFVLKVPLQHAVRESA